MKRYSAHTIESLATSELQMAYPDEITDDMLFILSKNDILSTDTGYGTFSVSFKELTNFISSELSIVGWPARINSGNPLTSIHLVNGQYAGVNDYRGK